MKKGRMMAKLRLMTVVGTRPEIIKLSEIIKKCDTYFDHVLVHTGQNYDYSLNKIFFDELGIRQPDHYLGVVGENLGVTMGNVIARSFDVMSWVKPDALLVLGDTNSCLSVISAKRLKIPVFHMEAGNRCFDENLPEEINRRIVDVTSDVNICYSEQARGYLNAAGVRPERTFVIGSPMAEIFLRHKESIEKSDVLSRLSLEKNKYILLSAHREENIDNEENFVSLMKGIDRMAREYGMPVIYSTHPRSRKVIEKRGIVFCDNVKSMEPFGFFDYVTLEKNAYCVVSDSGTLAEESAYFGFPAVSIRTSTERPEAIDAGCMIIGGIDGESICNVVSMAVAMNENGDRGTAVPSYTDTSVSSRVVKLIMSYTGIVNKIVWRKN